MAPWNRETMLAGLVFKNAVTARQFRSPGSRRYSITGQPPSVGVPRIHDETGPSPDLLHHVRCANRSTAATGNGSTDIEE